MYGNLLRIAQQQSVDGPPEGGNGALRATDFCASNGFRCHFEGSFRRCPMSTIAVILGACCRVAGRLPPALFGGLPQCSALLYKGGQQCALNTEKE
jgi:hypothetical protein